MFFTADTGRPESGTMKGIPKRNGFKPTIESAEDVYNYFVDFLKDKKKEHFYALLLDSKNRIIKEELISVGTLNASLIHPREVFKAAIVNSANSIILVHNHPSGDCEASLEDQDFTEKIFQTGELLKIKILDHVIIGKGNYHSFKKINEKYAGVNWYRNHLNELKTIKPEQTKFIS